MLKRSFGCAMLVLELVTILGCSRVGDVAATWENAGTPIKMRVLMLSEVNVILPGAYYRFQASVVGSSEWRDIMTFRHDDPVVIPKDQIRVIDRRLAYAFMGWMYAVTTDGGHRWSVWDATRDLQEWDCCNFGLIRDVELSPSGAGVMKLSVIPGRRGEVPDLFTTDFGMHWRPAGG